MMKILLVHPPGGLVNRFPGRPPLGLAYLAAAVREHNPMIVDQQINQQPLEIIVDDVQPDVIGFSLTTWSFRQIREVAQQLRRHHPDPLYVAGGPHPTAMPGQTLQSGFDVAVRGYGEETFGELVAAIEQGTDLEKVHGLSLVTREGKVHHTSPRRYVQTLDELSPPLYDAVDPARYQWCSVASSRGCPIGCLFCADSYLFGRNILFRSPESFVDELTLLNRSFGVNRFYIVDEQFTYYPERAMRICELIIRRRLDIQWQANSRVDRVSLDLLRKMKQAGCISVALGVESGSEAILKRVRKGISPGTVMKAVEACKEAGIRVKTSWIVGLPGSMEEQLASIELMEQTEPNHIDVYLLTVYPGTPFWRDAEKYGIFLDRENPPLTLREKLDSSRYHMEYLSKEQILEVIQKITEAMVSKGYRLAQMGEQDYDPQSKVLHTFLQSLRPSERKVLCSEFGVDKTARREGTG
jgi:anaerobic magnesium-protoporphyrin IX monomethyl ester cyclase